MQQLVEVCTQAQNVYALLHTLPMQEAGTAGTLSKSVTCEVHV